MTTKTTVDREITCKCCRERLEAVGGQWTKLRDTYRCGNISTISMGHQMMHTHEGPTSVCSLQIDTR